MSSGSFVSSLIVSAVVLGGSATLTGCGEDDAGGSGAGGTGAAPSGGSPAGGAGGAAVGGGGSAGAAEGGSGGSAPSIDCAGSCANAEAASCANYNTGCVTNCETVYTQLAPCAGEWAAFVNCSAALDPGDWSCTDQGDPQPSPACDAEDASFTACADAL